ncbi:hypothetical protein GIB67_016098 [Kingdonia uniflora]|uniref:Ent-kaurene synthase n=1 Tax=Kingdonia uniflora TaxID=39325 RepID=A0A7J7L255_9MAGN|nr:hypothetical protein GIB67_016098 [Kingdonia uniflora]
MDTGIKMSTRATTIVLCCKGPKDRIREMFTKVELSFSSYDTAWVGMVPNLKYPLIPAFPQCIYWLMETQLHDGSWGFPHRHPLMGKDTLISTLACVIALRKWDAGKEHVEKGLLFIGSNFSSATDEKQHSPIGFDIIFAGLIEYAQDLGINLHLSQRALDSIFQKRNLELKRESGSNCEGRNAYLGYVAEGRGDLQEWEEIIMKYQRNNGSLFNSPSTTAAALWHLKDINCFHYLSTIVFKFCGGVPATYPSDIYTRLRMVDNLERLGIDRYFRDEIKSVLDNTYRCWSETDEEIFLDTTTCALAFRILRMHGYDVLSDALNRYSEEELFLDTLGGYQNDMSTVLELYRASQITIFPDETILDKIHSWTSRFLRRELSSGSMKSDLFNKRITQEVDDALSFPYYANLERLENRRHVEHYDVDHIRILKTAFRPFHIDDRDFLELAVEDFNSCQSIHRKELKQLERWVEENKLDKLQFARQKLTYCYFSAAATLFAPEQSDARISWAKNSVLSTVVDDFFDIGGSKEELQNLIKLVEKWDGITATDCCSEQVEIVYFALHNSINEIGEKAFAWQGHCVVPHIIEIWLTLLKAMMREADWTIDKSVPTLDEYMTNGYVSFALGPIVLPALYFVGPVLPEEVVKDPEYHNLYKLMSTVGRLLNDIQGFKRESKEGKLNAVSLHMIHGNAVVTEEEAVKEMTSVIGRSRRELLRLVLQTNDSVVPRACKDLFWKMSKVVNLFYMSNDGFTSQQKMVNSVKAVIHEPLNGLQETVKHPSLSSSK